MNPGTDGASSVSLQGIEVKYVRRGSGPQMVLLHGGGGPQDSLPFFAKLAEKFDVIAPVHPGFGGTPIPEHFDDMKDLVFLLMDFMDALDVRDCVLLGFSMGGWAAAEIATHNMSRISKLILVDAVGVKPGGPFDRDIADIFGLPGPELTKLMFHDPSKAPNPANMTDEQLTMMAASRVALGLYTWKPYMHNPKLPYRLHRVTAPTLLIWGESDGLVPVKYAEAYRGMIPGAKLEVIPEAGHAPQVEQPDAFIDRVFSFAAS